MPFMYKDEGQGPPALSGPFTFIGGCYCIEKEKDTALDAQMMILSPTPKNPIKTLLPATIARYPKLEVMHRCCSLEQIILNR